MVSEKNRITRNLHYGERISLDGTDFKCVIERDPEVSEHAVMSFQLTPDCLERLGDHEGLIARVEVGSGMYLRQEIGLGPIAEKDLTEEQIEELDEFSIDDSLFVRFKIVNSQTKKIVALYEQSFPRAGIEEIMMAQQSVEMDSLIRVDHTDGIPIKVHFNKNWINPAPIEFPETSPLAALVWPLAFEMALNKVFFINLESGDGPDDDRWSALWSYIGQFFDEEKPERDKENPYEEEYLKNASEWIARVVDSWTRMNNFDSRFNNAEGDWK